MIDPNNVYHVTPTDDLNEHNETCTYPPIGEPYCDCPCKPQYEKVPPSGLIVIHNSFDGRENFEWDNRTREN